MAKHFNEVRDYDDGAFITVRFNDILLPNHKARYIKKFIERLDITEFERRYKVGVGIKGRSPKGIRMMLGVILYGMYTRIYSGHQLEKASYSYADFWIFTHRERISHDKTSDFINLHKEEIKEVFLETILLAENNKLLSFDALYVDGFQVKGNASKRRSHNKSWMKERRKKLSKRLEEILSQLQEKKEMAEESMKMKEKTEKELTKIDGLMKELNKRIKIRGDNRLPKEKKQIEEKLSINSTDKDAELMKMKRGGYGVGYTKINAVDGKADIIVASDVDGYYNESHKLHGIVKEANENIRGKGKYTKVCADSNFNTMGSCISMEVEGVELISPTKEHENEKKEPEKHLGEIKFRYDERNNCVECSAGQKLMLRGESVKKRHGTKFLYFENEIACCDCKLKDQCTTSSHRIVCIDVRSFIQEKVLNRYLSEEGKNIYKKRFHVAEVYQGDLYQNGKCMEVYRRGKEKVKVETILHDIIWNLRRIFNVMGEKIAWA